MTTEHSRLMRRVNAALYEPESINRREADALRDEIAALIGENERMRAERLPTIHDIIAREQALERKS